MIVYWIGPWLGVVLADQWLRRDRMPLELLYDRSYTNPAGLIAMVVGIVVSVVLFSNQTLFTGLVPRAVPEIGDITFLGRDRSCRRACTWCWRARTQV